MALMNAGKFNLITDQQDKPKLLGDIQSFGKDLTIQDQNQMCLWDHLYESIMWNSSAYLTQVSKEMKEESPQQYKDNKIGEYVTQGNVTEQAILNFFMGVYGGEGCVEKKK